VTLNESSTPAPDAVAPTAGRGRRSTGGAASRAIHRFGLVFALLGVVAVFSILRPSEYFSVQNFQTMLSTQSVLLILALALLPALASSEYDLSVGSVLGFSLVLVGYLNIVQHWSIGPTIAVTLAAGLLVGAVNALFVVIVGVDSIVVTLGTGSLMAGLALAINSLPISGVSESLVSASRRQLFGVQLVFFYGLALTIVLWYVFSFTPLGRYLYFVGANRSVSRLTGIPVSLIRVSALMAAALIASIGGVLQAGLLGGADPTVGPTLLLPAFASAFLGATAITPGRFNPWGTFVAVYFLVAGITGLQLLGYSGWVEQVFYGASLVLAVALSRLGGLRSQRMSGPS
jgi:ribose transport system permease protein